MSDSPRLLWVKQHAAELIALGESYGAHRLSLCGSVARGEDSDDSDIDFYVHDFYPGEPGIIERTLAADRADELVKAIRTLCPYAVDVRGIPGWPIDEAHETKMKQESIDLTGFIE